MKPACRVTAIALAAWATASGAAAQRADENAVRSADDAFGSVVGNEKTGIYSETDIRGFSPVKAGNLRVEGVYFDQQSSITSRVRAGSRIRVGIAALDYPFPAPTGIVDHQIRQSGDTHVISAAADRTNYGGRILELDTQAPLVEGRLSFTAGVAYAHNKEVDGSQLKNYAIGVAPRWRFDGGELIPFVAHFSTRQSTSRIVVSAPGPFTPPPPKPRAYLGQDWAQASSENTNFGFVTRASVGAWSLRAGLSESRLLKHSGYSEIFAVADAVGNARHRVIADPRQENRSVAGEGQIAWQADNGALKHRLLLMVRGRDKIADTGGSDSLDLGPVVLGQKDPEPEPTFSFGASDRSHVKQLTGAVGYMGRWRDFAQVNLGLQKVDYRATFRRPGQPVAATRDRPWLYNATFVVTPSRALTAYVAYVTGLEESGLAPENAANRNEVLPAARTEQIDGGARLKLGGVRLVASAFQISKPNFSFNASDRFVELGQVRHRGVEASLAGKFGGRLDLLAGAVLMDPVVTGEAVRLGRVGPRPVGVTRTLLRLDADYASPVKGVSVTVSATHAGARTASARTYAELGGRQLSIGSTTTVDLGVRYRFNVGRAKLNARATLANAFNDKSWRIVAPNSYQLSDSRRLAVFLVGDF